MKRENAFLLIITCILIFAGEYLRRNTNYIILGEILSILALGTAISMAFLKGSKLKKSYLLIMLVVLVALIIYPFIINR